MRIGEGWQKCGRRSIEAGNTNRQVRVEGRNRNPGIGEGRVEGVEGVEEGNADGEAV